MMRAEAVLNRVTRAIFGKIGLIGGTGLRVKSARGATVLGVGTVVERGARLVRNMILARILAPDEFGLMAIVLVATMAFEAFAEVGVKQAVIQNKRGAEQEYLNVAWWMQAIRGLGLFGIAFIAAPWISSFYDKPHLLRLLQVSFLAIVFRGFISPRVHVLEKEYKFGRVVFLIQGSALLGTIVAIGCALVARSVWALVAGFVAEAAILCMLSYILVPFLPRFRIDRECLGELMKFARGMFGLPILTMITMQTDIIIVGKIMVTGQLGMYYMVRLLAQYPMVLFSKIINPVLLPAFSEKQDDKQKLGGMVLVLTQAIAVFGTPFVVFMITCAKPILSVIYGSEYAAAVVPFGILCVYVLVYLQAVLISSVFLALGQPHLHRRFVAIRAIILLALMYPSIVWFGLSGAAMSVLLAYLIVLWVQVIYMRKSITIRVVDYLIYWLQGLLMSVVVLVVFTLLWFSGEGSMWVALAMTGLSCIGAWTIGLLFLRRYWRTNTRKTICVGSELAP